MQFTAWARGLRVTADGSGVVSHVGAVLLRMLADRAGLTAAMSGALARRGWWPGHDRGWVVVDLAVMIADGGEAICDIVVIGRSNDKLNDLHGDDRVSALENEHRIEIRSYDYIYRAAWRN